ncbi:hypothetical protein PIB30_078776, partial [Stylosanthes scabra]|nr:hypothetical protein [Stylosanthes scabra]
ETIGARAQRYFEELFTTSSPQNPAETLREVRRKITADTNNSLTRPVQEKEIKCAVFSINPEAAWR